MKIIDYIALLVKRILIFILIGLRPLLGAAHCRYHVGCTQFAVQQLQQTSFFKACWRIIRRVLSCNPFSPSYEIGTTLKMKD